MAIHKSTLERKKQNCPTSPDGLTIPLTQGQFAVVDPEDYEALACFNWCAIWNHRSKTFYAARGVRQPNGSYRMVFMHRVIMNPPDNAQIDHIDHNGTRNIKRNMRTATQSENQFNRKATAKNALGLKGVSYHRPTNQWRARIQVDKKQTHLGLFPTPEAANAAYIEAAKRMHGEFANW